ncbi:MAG: hypothetical protein HY007_02345 [Candidatus Sungbacteria bacterium]|nr:hypothetical protein [Candidatus Sungbacteria bacterium]
MKVDLGVMSFITLVTFLLFWSGWITKKGGLAIVGGMIAAAGIAFILFAIRSGLDAENKAARKYLLLGAMIAITMYFVPILQTFWVDFGTFSPKTKDVVVYRLKEKTEEFLVENLGKDNLVAQELVRCNAVMLADQKPFLEGSRGLEKLPKRRVDENMSQDLYERWHTYNIVEIQKVHERRRQCGERARLLSPSAKSTGAPSTNGGIPLAAKILTFAIGAILLIGWSTSRMSASTSLVYLAILVGAWIVFWGGSGWAVGLNLNWLPTPVAQWIRAHATVIVTVLLGYFVLILLWQTRVGEFVAKPLLGTAVAATTILFVYWIVLGGGWRFALSLLPKM